MSDLNFIHSKYLLTVALTFFRITVALIFGKLVPKVTKPYLGSISSSNLYDLRVDNAKK